MVASLFAIFAFIGQLLVNPDFRQVELLRRSIAFVDNGTGHGTGWIVKARSGKKYVVTNAHVCDTATQDITLRFGSDATKEVPVEWDLQEDICLVTLIDQSRPELVIHEGYEDGEAVAAIGYPQDYPLTLSKGKVLGLSAVFIPPYIRVSIMVDALIRPGNSGSPLLNEKNEVVGVINASNGVVGAALPVGWVQRILYRH